MDRCRNGAGWALVLVASVGCGSSPTSTGPSTPPVTITVPGAPSNVVVTPANGALSVAFAPPSTDGGAAITGFTATCSAGGSTASASGATSPLVVTGLTNGTTYSCTVVATNSKGAGSPSAAAAATPAAPVATSAFRGTLVLGAPTNTGVTANVYAADQAGTVAIQYGTVSGLYTQQTTPVTIAAGTPVMIPITGLQANTRYFFRLQYQASSASTSGTGAEGTFQTARPTGSTFTFMVQGDSHPERVKTQFDSTFYVRTLQTAAADRPDFYIMLGDDFSVDLLNPATVTAAQVTQRYQIQRPYLGIIGMVAPVFLVNGNHEQAARYLLDGTPNNVAVWAQNARNQYYAQPATDGFYSGNTEQVPFIGLLRNYYAWQWGDALFVTIDPYWGSSICVDNPFDGSAKRSNLWDVTLGEAQYQWLKSTLEKSTAKYKFVFAHHVLGTDRGGIEIAKNYEWGGLSPSGINEFAKYRPTWPSTIHQLFVANKVSAFFQGHDHIWVHQTLDGVTYQEVSEPADPNYSLFNADAYRTGEAFPNSGYTRVTVSPSGVKVEYVRTYLAADVAAGKTNGVPVFSYTIP